MGLFQSRSSEQTPDTDASLLNAYHYPPKTGNYFGSHFIMGGEKFESSKLDTYLFGENEDLNFLGGKPVPFPYASTQANEPTRTLKSLVNIRRDSLKLVKETENIDGLSRYNIEFVFDTDVRCAITIYYHATEEIHSKHVIYKPRNVEMNSETFHYKRGANQLFSQPSHFIDLSFLQPAQWQYNFEKEIIPIVIHCVVEEEEHIGHSHVTFGVIDYLIDGSLNLRALKQKQIIDGLPYLLQEIYGIENKNSINSKNDEEVEDNGSECVICMCELRDTIILPCRHLCLCNSCAEHLRYQANNCPICRSKFKALLQIRAINKITNPSTRHTANEDGIPSGYVAVSLIEALNGPTLPHRACHPPATFTSDATLQSLLNAAPTITSHITTTNDGEARLAGEEETSSFAEEEISPCEEVNRYPQQIKDNVNGLTSEYYHHSSSSSLNLNLKKKLSSSNSDSTFQQQKLSSSSSLHTTLLQHDPHLSPIRKDSILQQQEPSPNSSDEISVRDHELQLLASSSSGTYNSSNEQLPDEQLKGQETPKSYEHQSSIEVSPEVIVIDVVNESVAEESEEEMLDAIA